MGQRHRKGPMQSPFPANYNALFVVVDWRIVMKDINASADLPFEINGQRISWILHKWF